MTSSRTNASIRSPDITRASSSGSTLSPVQRAASRLGNSNLLQRLQSQSSAPTPQASSQPAAQPSALGQSSPEELQMAARARKAGDLKGAISAFGDAHKAADLRDIYLDLRALDGDLDHLLAASNRIARAGVAVALPARPASGSTEYGHRLDSLRDDLRAGVTASIEMRLKRYGLTIPAFRQQLDRFTQAFNGATADLAFNLLDQAEGLCRWYLDDVHELQTAAGRMTDLLGPGRKSIVADIEQAEELRDRLNWVHRGDFQESEDMRRQSNRLRADAHARVISALAAYPFVRWPGFPLEALAESQKPERVAALVRFYLKEHVAQLRDARGQINPDRIYQLDLLLKSAREGFGIRDGSIAALLIEEQKQRVGTNLWQKIEAALAFALMVIGAIVPATLPVTAPASALLGAHAAAASILQYREDRTAYRAGLMSENPSPLWALVAVIGAGLEITAALRLLRLKPVAEALSRFGKSRNVAELSTDLERAGLNPTARRVITSEADELAEDARAAGTASTQPAATSSSAAPSAVQPSTAPSSVTWRSAPGSSATPSSSAPPPVTPRPRQIPVQQGTQSPGFSGAVPDGPPSGATRLHGQRPVGTQPQRMGPSKPPEGTPPHQPATGVDPPSPGATPHVDPASHVGADPPKPPRNVKDLLHDVRNRKATTKTGDHFDERLTPGERRANEHRMTEEERAAERRVDEQKRAAKKVEERVKGEQQKARERAEEARKQAEENLPPAERARLAKQREEAEKKRAENWARRRDKEIEREDRLRAKRRARAKARAEEKARREGKAPPHDDDFLSEVDTAKGYDVGSDDDL